jgi:hypothetical protein
MEFKIEFDDYASYENIKKFYLSLRDEPYAKSNIISMVVMRLPDLIDKGFFCWFRLACEYFFNKVDLLYVFQDLILRQPRYLRKFNVLERILKENGILFEAQYIELIKFCIQTDLGIYFSYFFNRKKSTINFNPLLLACTHSSTNVAKFLIEQNPYLITEETFIEAARVGSLEILKKICEVRKFYKESYQMALRAAVSFYNSHLAAEIMSADYVGDLGIVKFLKDKIRELK